MFINIINSITYLMSCLKPKATETTEILTRAFYLIQHLKNELILNLPESPTKKTTLEQCYHAYAHLENVFNNGPYLANDDIAQCMQYLDSLRSHLLDYKQPTLSWSNEDNNNASFQREPSSNLGRPRINSEVLSKFNACETITEATDFLLLNPIAMNEITPAVLSKLKQLIEEYINQPENLLKIEDIIVSKSLKNHSNYLIDVIFQIPSLHFLLAHLIQYSIIHYAPEGFLKHLFRLETLSNQKISLRHSRNPTLYLLKSIIIRKNLSENCKIYVLNYLIKDCFIDLNESNLVEQFLTFTVSKASKSLIARFVHTDTTLLSHAAMKSDPINIFMTQIILRRNHTTITINADNKDTDIDDILIKEFFQHVVWQNQEKLKIIEFFSQNLDDLPFLQDFIQQVPKEPQGLPQENCLLIAKMIQNISSRLNQRKMLDSATRFQLANAGLTAAQAAESTMLQQYFSAEQQICSIDDCLVAWRDTKDLDQLFAAVNDFIPFIEQGCTIETYNYLKQIVVDLSTEKCLDHNQFNLDSNQGINFISWFTRSIEAESYFWIEILAELAPINISIFEDIILFLAKLKDLKIFSIVIEAAHGKQNIHDLIEFLFDLVVLERDLNYQQAYKKALAQLCQSGFSIRGMSIEAYYRLLSFIESYATFNDFYFLKSQSEIPEYFMADLAKRLIQGALLLQDQPITPLNSENYQSFIERLKILEAVSHCAMPCKEDLDIFLAWVKPTLELLPEHWKHLANIVENIHQNFHTSNSDDHTIKQSLAILGLNAAIKADNHALVSLFQEAIKMPLIVAANTHFLSRILQYKNAVFRQNNAEADQTKISKLNRLLVSFYNFGMANTSLQGKDWIKQWLIEQTSQGMNPLAVLRQNVAISLFKFSFLDLIIEYAGPLSRPENQPQEPQPATHQSRTANP